ncbi:unnamed protein product [Trichobilharzia regenti]|nr:unnamed protein product [Trichobilharzia regenti]
MSQPLTPQQQHPSITFNRISPQQRRYERQNCRDSRRLGGLVRSSVNPSTSSTTTALSSVPICDYCLGSEAINPRIGHSEGMLHCSRCGHYGHYTCLRLSPHVIEAAVRYPWQCIGCKTCWLCDQGWNENSLFLRTDRMIFCWDCDRVFHAHCLRSRLPRSPDTHWTCDICIHELYNSNNTKLSFEQRTHSNSGYDPYSNNNNSGTNSNSLNQIHSVGGDGYFTTVQHHAHNIPRS